MKSPEELVQTTSLTDQPDFPKQSDGEVQSECGGNGQTPLAGSRILVISLIFLGLYSLSGI